MDNYLELIHFYVHVITLVFLNAITILVLFIIYKTKQIEKSIKTTSLTPSNGFKN
uniref:Uncharacterized protein n=1 Tax=viral metagenome TaxID=1070528 RepID=A0A6C0KYW0_9ZZZZ